jgi:hypothetical protein
VKQILALKKGPRIRELFSGIEYILKPIITQIECMIAAGKELRLNPRSAPKHIEDIDPLDIKLTDLGVIGEEIFAAYKEMPLVRNMSNGLSGLVKTTLKEFQKLSIKEMLTNLMEMTGKMVAGAGTPLNNLFGALNGYFDDLKAKFAGYRENTRIVQFDGMTDLAMESPLTQIGSKVG